MGWRDITTWIPFGGAIDLATRHVTGESVVDYKHCQPSTADCETPSVATLQCNNCCWKVFLKGLSELGLNFGADVVKGTITATVVGAGSKAAARTALKKLLTGLGLFGAIGTAVDTAALLVTLYKMWDAYHEAMEIYCVCPED